jgi:hypothetical protein
VDKGWQDVSKEFGEPVPECKKKWRHLRSSLSRYIKSSKDELKNKNNKLKPYYLLTHMNFLVPFTKTLDSKPDMTVHKFDESQYDDEMKADEDPSSFEHEIIQDEDSANDEMEGNIVYEAYEIQEPIPTSSATSQSQTKSQITLVRSSHSSNSQSSNVQQLPMNQALSINQLSSTPPKPQQLQLNTSQFTQIQQQTPQSHLQSSLQNTIIPIPDDQSSADLNFFLALLPDIKIMNQEQKRKLRIGTLKLIDDILSAN